MYTQLSLSEPVGERAAKKFVIIQNCLKLISGGLEENGHPAACAAAQ